MANGDNKELRPGNGAGTFSDYLVGNQYVTGTPQFTLGNFSVTDSVPTKDDRDFDLGSFSEPITLSTLNIESVEEHIFKPKYSTAIGIIKYAIDHKEDLESESGRKRGFFKDFFTSLKELFNN